MNIEKMTDEGLERILKSILSKDNLSKEDMAILFRMESVVKERKRTETETIKAEEAAKKVAIDRERLEFEKKKHEAEIRSEENRIKLEERKLEEEIRKHNLDNQNERARFGLDREKLLAEKKKTEAEIQKIDAQFKGDIIKTIGTIGTAVLYVGALTGMYYDGLEFEKEGVVTSSFLTNTIKNTSKLIKL